jgi:two-component system sensor histidine kinase VicK
VQVKSTTIPISFKNTTLYDYFPTIISRHRMSTDINVILRQMADQSDEICFIYNITEERFDYISSAFESITKRKRKGFTDHPAALMKIVHQDDLPYLKNAYQELLENKSAALLNFRIHQPDQNERWIRLKVSPIIEKGKLKYLTGLGEDDSARKASIFNMQKINGWKDANLEILTHDLRGPIGSVQMLTSLIDKKIPNNPELQKLTGMITEISKRNIELIQTLLKEEFLATAEVEISRERLDVIWEINQAVDIYLLSQENIQKQIQFTHSHEKIYAEVDSMKFLQIINNLISNAIKFTHDNGHIKIHVEKLDTTFLVTVKDDGIGIPKSLQPILFKKYTKAGREGLEGEESVGLGMWIVKKLTEAHGGKIWFESASKKGTTFYVEIPLGTVIE